MDWDELYTALVTTAGWSWEHIDQCVTIPQALALMRSWETTPPPAVQLRRIAVALGIQEPKKVQTSKPQTMHDTLHELAAAGIPVMEGRPNDPMLDLIGL